MPAVNNPKSVAATTAGQIAKLEKQVKDLSVNKVYTPNSWHVGAGGLIVDGTSTLTGAVSLPNGIAGSVSITGGLSTSSAASIGGYLTVAGTIAATGQISGPSLSVTGTSSSGGDGYCGGIMRIPSVYGNTLSSSYRAVWTTSVDGSLGYSPSSARFKQDIEDFHPDPATILQLRLVSFRYIQAVNDHGDHAAREVSVIAEEVHDLGLEWLVDYDDDGAPFGVKFHLMAFALLSVAQDFDTRLAAVEAALRSS